MFSTVNVGWTVLFNDHAGVKCPALVTKVYTPGNINSNLDLHVVGFKLNASLVRGKLNVAYGENIIGTWQYQDDWIIRINTDDFPLDGQGLLYNSTTDRFETEDITSAVTDVDGGIF